MTCQDIYSVANDALHERQKTAFLAAEKYDTPCSTHTGYTDDPAVCCPTEHLGLAQDPKFLTPCGSREKKLQENASTLVIIRLVITDWGDECILLALNTNQRQHTTTDHLLSDQLMFALPRKGSLLLEGHVEGAGHGRRAAQDTVPTAEVPAGMLPVPTARQSAARSFRDLGTPGPPGPELPK